MDDERERQIVQVQQNAVRAAIQRDEAAAYRWMWTTGGVVPVAAVVANMLAGPTMGFIIASLTFAIGLVVVGRGMRRVLRGQQRLLDLAPRPLPPARVVRGLNEPGRR